MQGVRGTGADGRIVSRDVAGVQAAAPTTAAAPSAGPYEHIELSNMRKVCTHQVHVPVILQWDLSVLCGHI